MDIFSATLPLPSRFDASEPGISAEVFEFGRWIDLNRASLSLRGGVHPTNAAAGPSEEQARRMA